MIFSTIKDKRYIMTPDKNQNPAPATPGQPAPAAGTPPPAAAPATPPAAAPASPSTSDSEDNSLEGTGTIVEAGKSADEAGGGGGSIDTSGNGLTQKPEVKLPGRGPLQSLKRGFNLYLILFFAVALVAILIIVFAVSSGTKQANKAAKVNTQSVSDATLKQLANSDVTVGDPKQVLNVQSNAVFAGKVLVRDSLEVAGQLSVSGSLSLSGITVNGTSKFQDVQIGSTLGVAGDTIFQSGVSIQKALSVTGSGTFGSLTAGTISTSNLQLNSDLQLSHHITVNGAIPGRSSGTALGAGGTSTVNGSDTAGSVNINTGSSPPAGCFVTVNFTQKYASTPHILLTPVESGAGGIAYYVTRTTTSFSICAATPPPANASFGFDYFVIG
jgi:cytoskeletal protein CcmA (bactofilin family)